MSKSKKEPQEEIVCEFFGIKITTKNPNLAKVLTTDVNEFLHLDVKDIKEFFAGKNDVKKKQTAKDEKIESDWSSLKGKLKKINELLE